MGKKNKIRTCGNCAYLVKKRIEECTIIIHYINV